MKTARLGTRAFLGRGGGKGGGRGKNIFKGLIYALIYGIILCVMLQDFSHEFFLFRLFLTHLYPQVTSRNLEQNNNNKNNMKERKEQA